MFALIGDLTSSLFPNEVVSRSKNRKLKSFSTLLFFNRQHFKNNKTDEEEKEEKEDKYLSSFDTITTYAHYLRVFENDFESAKRLETLSESLNIDDEVISSLLTLLVALRSTPNRQKKVPYKRFPELDYLSSDLGRDSSSKILPYIDSKKDFWNHCTYFSFYPLENPESHIPSQYFFQPQNGNCWNRTMISNGSLHSFPPLTATLDSQGQRHLRFPKKILKTHLEIINSSNCDLNSKNESEFEFWDQIVRDEIPKRRTWESLGSIPTPEKPFITESKDSLQKLRLLVIEDLKLVSGILSFESIVVIDEKDLIRDIGYLLIGIVSQTFQCDLTSNTFSIRHAGTCIQDLTPEILKSFTRRYLEIGTHVRLLDQFSNSNKEKSLIYSGFCLGIKNFLDLYRNSIIKAMETVDSLCAFDQKIRPLIKHVIFLSTILKLKEPSFTFPKGIQLIYYLLDETLSITSKKLYFLLVSILKSTSDPYFKFLEKWLFQGICYDEYSEFGLTVDHSSLSLRNRRYWTDGYKLTEVNQIGKYFTKENSSFLSDVHQQIFNTGKSFNLLQLIYPQHHLVSSSMEHPTIKLLVTPKEERILKEQTLHYTTLMTAIAETQTLSYEEYKRRVEKEKEESLRKMTLRHLDTMKRIREENETRHNLERERKNKLRAEIKKQADESLKRKEEEKKRDIEREKDWREKALQREADELQRENEIKREMRDYYQYLGRISESRERKAKWKMSRNELREKRIKFWRDENVKNDILTQVPRSSIVFSSPLTNEMDTTNKGISLENKLPSSSDEGSDSQRPQFNGVNKKMSSFFDYDTNLPFITKDSEILVSPLTPTTTVDGRKKSVSQTIEQVLYPKLPLNTHRVKVEESTFSNSLTAKVRPYNTSFSMTNYPSLKNFTDNLFPPKDEKEDIDEEAFIPLSILMENSILIPLKAQSSLVNKALLNCLLVDSQLVKVFEILRSCLLFHDGEFSHSLSHGLFKEISNEINGFLPPFTLNTLVDRAIQSSSLLKGNPFAQNIGFNLTHNTGEQKDILSTLELTYKSEWPINLIINQDSLQKYGQIFRFLLRVKKSVWALEKAFYKLLSLRHESNGSQQYHSLQIMRHEMLNFVILSLGYVSSQVYDVTWKELLSDLMNQISCLDELHESHQKYLDKAIFRCLLNKKAGPVQKIISEIFNIIVKFSSTITNVSWSTKIDSIELIHPLFHQLETYYASFKEYSSFLYQVITKLAERGYQHHLQDLLLRLNYNGFYQKDIN